MRYKTRKESTLLAVLLAAFLMAGCQDVKIPPPVVATRQPSSQTSQPTPVESLPTAMPSARAPIPLTIWLDPSVPTELQQELRLPISVQRVSEAANASLTIQPVTAAGQSRWIYALVARFPTLDDGVSSQDLRQAWAGKPAGIMAGHTLLVTKETRTAFESLWGPASTQTVRTSVQTGVLEGAWAETDLWAIIPFEEIEPRWKVLRVDGLSPMDKAMDASSYPLAVSFDITGSSDALAALEAAAPGVTFLPATNRDPDKMTVLLMTGVTALVRATAAKMENEGMTYPAEDILDWFRSADLRHISNEVAFSEYCPPANAYQQTLQFCSRPEYIQLLEYIGANVIELSGNHILDWNADSFLYTLKLYREHNWQYYAAGENLKEARRPLKIEDHGNKLAFLGCNPAGPTFVWAGEDTPGAANCDDMEWLHVEIKQLREEGYLPIVTFQYHEYYTPDARPWQVVDYEGMAKAGAVIVSGSQAHTPQGFGFLGSSFIHYGVGNLFFDQMDVPVVGTRREFLDRHVFYNGRYLGVDLLTAMLEDFARPRPMTPEERRSLLEDMFVASGWGVKAEK